MRLAKIERERTDEGVEKGNRRNWNGLSDNTWGEKFTRNQMIIIKKHEDQVIYRFERG